MFNLIHLKQIQPNIAQLSVFPTEVSSNAMGLWAPELWQKIAESLGAAGKSEKMEVIQGEDDRTIDGFLWAEYI